jgi:hypothetical protein
MKTKWGRHLFRLAIAAMLLAYGSKWALQEIQVDFFTTYPELNPANPVPGVLRSTLP